MIHDQLFIFNIHAVYFNEFTMTKVILMHAEWYPGPTEAQQGHGY